MKRHVYKGFTIVELLVVVSIIALLIGILLPAIGKARDKARVTTSVSNLRQLAVAHNAYAGDWEDAQLSLCRYNISIYGSSDNYGDVIGYNGQHPTTGHPGIVAGWANGGLWAFWPQHPNGNQPWAVEAINFPDGPNPNEAGFGWFRIPNVSNLAKYVNGKHFDRIFFAPKDFNWDLIEPCFDQPGEYAPLDPCNTHPHMWSTYALSPASLLSPDVLSLNEETGEYWTDPWELPGGHRTPTMGSIRYPTLKTHMLEHPWLQNIRKVCNPAFSTHDNNCEEYFFNPGFESTPATLFYDGHVRLMGTQEALNANRRHVAQTGGPGVGYGLWSIDTPFEGGYAPSDPGGYYMDFAYDFTSTSYHILTIDGSLGRDTLGGAQ